MKLDYYQRLKKARIIPVIQLDDIDAALPLAETLISNGMPIAEVTLRSDAALESIQRISREFPEMLMIAGTILNPDQADQAVAAGAHMVVSPGFNPATVAHCVSQGIEIIPGVVTPGEMEQAMMHGLTLVKFFPAEVSGGVRFLKAVSAPYQSLEFMPTGGISKSNVGDYLALKPVLCCGGSWMVQRSLIQTHDWQTIGEKVSQAVNLVQQMR